MSPMSSYVIPYVLGIGLILVGSLMLARPKLFYDIPPDPTQTLRGIRIGGLVVLLLGVLWILELLTYGLVPCGPDNCLNF